MNEFLVLPLGITAAFCVAAVMFAWWDNQGSAPALRRFAGLLIRPSGAAAFLGVVAESLMAVTSITFSVLLIAVQQTSSFLGAVVFDQYLRRRANQAYLGYFVGATAFSFIVFACASSGYAPVFGASAALVLTLSCAVGLLLLIHSTVDQMRPESVVNVIHKLALRAHEGELALLAGTRRERLTPPEAEARAVTTRSSGYVVSIDAGALAAVARSAGAEVEVFLPCQLGTYLEVGANVALIVGVTATDDSLDAATLSAFTLDDIRRVEVDTSYSIDQLENIAWMTSTSAQSPFTASTVIHRLRDLVSRWAVAEQHTRDSSRDSPELLLPVVYADGALERVLSGYGNLLIASSESRQADIAALLITSFAHALPLLGSEHRQVDLIGSLNATLPCVTRQAASPLLMDALVELVSALEAAGQSAEGVKHVKAVLQSAAKHLLADPSTVQSEPPRLSG